MNRRIFASVEDLARGAAGLVLRTAESLERPVIALSGGSTPRAAYELLGADPYRKVLAAKPILWVLEDERCVPPDHPDSNAKMIMESLFRNGIPSGHRFLHFNTELVVPAKIAADFGRQWQEASLDRIDLSLLGVGGDGHTASLFPGTSALDETQRIATEVYVPRLSTWRVTLTMPVLKASVRRAALVSGEGKREILKRVATGEAFPIAQVMAGDDSWWLIDEAAAGESVTSAGER